MWVAIWMMHIVVLAGGQYQWTIFEQEHLDLCALSSNCGGRQHTMCYKANDTHPRCKKFEPIALGEDSVRSFMMGHNGLRNKVATNPRQPATDMQFLTVFFHPKPILKHWEALALSTWFSEKDRLGNNLSVGSLQREGVSNYTQLIWARTQFVGCGAAGMYGGHLVVCYYYPKGNNVGEKVFSVGRRACTGCPHERASCSHVFRGLCGI
uniref:SCP domain-containing protein n=1 Tax=Anopheles dirus TaxID=7168 RepID=A0A182NR62_9DIPT